MRPHQILPSHTSPGHTLPPAQLRAHASPATSAALEQVEKLEELLSAHYAAGQAQWASVPLTPERFMRHLARHLPEGSPEVLRQLHAADLYLACACSEAERHALLAFEQHILQKVPARLGQLPAATVDEVLQVRPPSRCCSASAPAVRAASPNVPHELQKPRLA